MIIRNKGRVIARNVRVCRGFMKVIGLRFTFGFGPYDAYLFEGNENIMDMFFVFHKILIVWLDENKRVVDKGIAFPFGVYAPSRKSRYVLEFPVKKNKDIKLGDKLVF